jgi:hypothetical protein
MAEGLLRGLPEVVKWDYNSKAEWTLSKTSLNFSKKADLAVQKS